jgi:hypothetical protein
MWEGYYRARGHKFSTKQRIQLRVRYIAICNYSKKLQKLVGIILYFSSNWAALFNGMYYSVKYSIISLLIIKTYSCSLPSQWLYVFSPWFWHLAESNCLLLDRIYKLNRAAFVVFSLLRPGESCLQRQRWWPTQSRKEGDWLKNNKNKSLWRSRVEEDKHNRKVFQSTLAVLLDHQTHAILGHCLDERSTV